MSGVVAENARVGAASGEPDAITGIEDPRPVFADQTARLKAAEKAYRAALGPDAKGTLAHLGLAGVLYDLGKFQEALGEYRIVRQSKLSETDADARCRSIEGAGMSEEGLDHLDAALKAYGELASSDVVGFAPLGQYHQARIYQKKGDVEKAKSLLKEALQKLEKNRTPGEMPTFTEQAARDFLLSIDPSAALAQNAASLTPEQLQALTEQAGGDGDASIDREKLNKLLKQLTQKQAPAAPSGAPSSKP